MSLITGLLPCTKLLLLYFYCFNTQDVFYGDIDYMDRQRDFTIDEEIYGEDSLAKFVQDIKEEGTNYIIILVGLYLRIKLNS